MDPSVPNLLLASQLNVPQQHGAFTRFNASSFSAVYDKTLRAVILGKQTILRVGPLDPLGCPRKLTTCLNVSLLINFGTTNVEIDRTLSL